MGFSSLALTDINNLYGVHDFIDECRKNSLRPIVGVELRRGGERALLLARDGEGFSSMCRLVTAVNGEAPMDLCAELAAGASGTVIITDTERLLGGLKGAVEHLYALVTPFSRAAEISALRLDLPLAAAGEAMFLEEGDFQLHRLLRAIHGQTRLADISQWDCAPEGAVLFSPEQAEGLFPGQGEALETTAEIAGLCRFDTVFRGFVFPPYEGMETAAALKELRKRVYAGAEARYGELSESVTERIDYELDIIGAKGFAPYFLVVGDIVSGASHTCGRGSAAASIVSYSLGITNVDPVGYNLYFERFLNPERMDPPDIDVDFAWDERDAIIDSVMARHGRGRSAMVCTMIHYRLQSALRETGRALGIPDREISAMQDDLLRGRFSFRDMDEVWRDILSMAMSIRGFPRHLSVHPGGVIITPEPVAGYVPVERAAKGVPVITWDKDGAEDAGLVKIDLLGNRSLAVVRDAIAACARGGVIIDPLSWRPAEDRATVDLMARGNTMGVFYVESPATRQLQAKTGAGDFDHIVIASSMIRPAANRYINEYVDRLRGKSYRALHPALDHILKETYGIMCYQEDVSRVAVAMAGFSPAEADGLRKILTKKNRDAKLKEYHERFFANAADRGVAPEIIGTVWDMILSFDGYSFCKPHSASYAMVSFQSAWLKAHHGAEFMAAVLSNGGGYYTASAYISEARRMGLTVLGPDVNESFWHYLGRDRSLRVGLMALAGLRRETATRLLEDRGKRGPFASIEDLQERVSVPPSDCEALVACGAMDSLSAGLNRPRQLWKALALCDGAGRADESALFHGATVRTPGLPDLTTAERLRQEYRVLGFLVNHHPLALWRSELSPYRSSSCVTGNLLPRFTGRHVSIVGWLVTRKALLTGKGQAMEFVSFEDETAIFETVFFPEAYQRFGRLLEEDRPFLLKGRVDNDRGALSLQVRHMERIVENKARCR
jgi:DNA polymerase-3 subunit alpha/error-prone DNA polymerase